MSKLTGKDRSSLSSNIFGIPSAKARASQMYKQGNLSASEKSQINGKANHVINHTPGCGGNHLGKC